MEVFTLPGGAYPVLQKLNLQQPRATVTYEGRNYQVSNISYRDDGSVLQVEAYTGKGKCYFRADECLITIKE